MRQVLAAVAAAALMTAGASARSMAADWPVIAAIADPGAIPLYGAATPGRASSEIWFKFEGQVVSVRNVTYPTLTPVLPAPGKATGAAVIVAPGGAYEFLSIDHEGWKIAHALADHGVAAFVLKYRLKPTPADEGRWRADLLQRLAALTSARKDGPAAQSRAASALLQFHDGAEDAIAAVALVRSNASRWGVDPHRVGMIGFSAGAAATLSGVLAAKPDQEPDFFGLIYGPMARVEVPAAAPPMFAALALDDPYFADTSIIDAWRDAKRPAELHLYQSGGHGFGLGRPGETNALWMDEFMSWLSMQGVLKRP